MPKYNGIFTSSLWYIEFFAFAVVLILFFHFFLYIANLNYVTYNPRYDTIKKFPVKPLRLKHAYCRPQCSEPCNSDHKPVCCDAGCIWFCRLIGTIMTIAFCYYFAYSLISDAKLKFGLFVYM